MSLIYIIVEFESFLKEVLEVTFKVKPEAFTSREKSITFENLLSCEDLESAKNEIIDSEISKVLNDDINAVNKYFEKALKVNLEKNVDWDKFTERFHRRNAIVHSQGIADKKYRKCTGCTKKDVDLTVTEKYLNETIELFETVASTLSTELSQKFLNV